MTARAIGNSNKLVENTDMMGDRITLYDLPGKAGNVCASPNVWKTRLMLNYKNIPYRVEWIDLPDIAPTLESYGVPPNPPETRGAAAGAKYTLPTIKLPDGTFLMGSGVIAYKLAAMYPDPPLSLELEEEAHQAYQRAVLPLFPNLMPKIRDNWISEHALPYWTRTREALFGMSVDRLRELKGGEKAWEVAKPGLDGLRDFLTKQKKDAGPFVFGIQVSYADFVICGILESSRMTDEAIFKRVIGFDDSFATLYEGCKPWLRDNN